MRQESRDIAVAPPKFSLGKVFSTLKNNIGKYGLKGIIYSLEDEEQGPHVHLTLLLITVVFVSVGIIIISRII